MAREEAMRIRPASVSRDTLYLLRRLLSNQHTLTGSEFRAELEKIVGEAYQQEAQEPVSPRHPVVIQWRDNAIEACAKIADAYGHEHAAQDMRAMLTAHQQEAQEPWGYARKSPGCGWYLCSKRHHEEAVADGFETKKLYTAPQPAPAPLSDDVVKDAARYRWLRDFHHGDVQDELPYIAAGEGYDGAWALTGEDADKGIDAAIATQGGKE